MEFQSVIMGKMLKFDTAAAGIHLQSFILSLERRGGGGGEEVGGGE